MKTDELGIPRFTNRDLIDMIYSGHADKIHVVLCDANDEVDRFNEIMKEQGLSSLQKYIPIDVDQKTFDGVCQSEWYMPKEYKCMNVHDYLIEKCNTQEEKDRVYDEVMEYDRRGMINLLRYMIYLVDFMRENNIVWGVGRGSSVASYVLYLIGVHRIDSIQYDLDWREFLK
jgi:DNA polymerase III alpha subunit